MQQQGVIHGRFQPFHADHLRYLLAGFEHCAFLHIGITNPEGAGPASPNDPARSKPEANPYSFFHRAGMIEAALDEAGVERGKYRIVPFPIMEPFRWGSYVPLESVFFLSIYDAWGEEKLRRFQEQGMQCLVLRRCQPEEKGISATTVRDLMRENGNWQEYLPAAVTAYIEEKGLVLG